jgi:transcriptional accessory protein Tex/SPT6
VSQLANHFVKDPSTSVKGDVVKVPVVEVDLEAQADRSIHTQGRGAAASRDGRFERSFRKQREQEARAPANPTSAKVHA